jgi:uncharacterized protein involved in exopolysaccharide biosynthesis
METSRSDRSVTGNHENGEVDFLELALAVAEQFRLIVVLTLLVGVLTLAVSFLIPKKYSAVTRVLPPAQQQLASSPIAAQLGSLVGLGLPTLKNPSDQYVALLKSRTVMDAIIARFGLKDLYSASYQEEARKTLEQRVKISAGLKDGIISLQVDDNDPKRAAEMANAFVDELRKLSSRLAITEAGQRRLFFEQQMSQAKVNLTNADVALRQTGIGEDVLKTMPQSALEGVARLKAQLTAQEIRLASMRAFMTDSNPDLKLAQEELSALKAALSKAEQASSGKGPGNDGEYVQRYRDYKYYETLFELMAKQYELARLDEAREGAILQVIDVALPPEKHSWPNRALLSTGAAIATFILAIIAAIVRRALFNMAANPDVAEKLTRLRRSLALR